jgi:hypothetical protein
MLLEVLKSNRRSLRDDNKKGKGNSNYNGKKLAG